MLNAYDSRWSIEWQRHHQDFDYVAHFNHYYRPLAGHNVTVDILSADEQLTGYRLVIAPALMRPQRPARGESHDGMSSTAGNWS